jgi:hypothetical protein
MFSSTRIIISKERRGRYFVFIFEKNEETFYNEGKAIGDKG